MKKTIYLFFVCMFFFACFGSSKVLQLKVENPCDFDRTNDLAEIPRENLSLLPLKSGQVYEVKNQANKVISSQLTFDGQLIFRPGLKAKESAVFTVSGGKKQTFEAQTFGRPVPERYDDFAWENDRVAFRIYGQALVPVDGPSNGLDIWYKRTDRLIIDQWYKDDLAGTASYHNDNGEGLDDYKVGRTLGAGAMAPYCNDTLWLNENFVSSEIFDNGPLRTTFKLTYKNITANGKTFGESRTFSIDAGSQLTKVSQEYGTTEIIPVAAGIIKRNRGDSLIVAPDKTYVEYLEPATGKTTGVYVGLVFPQGIDKITTNSGHVLAVVDYRPNQPTVYYAGYGWTQFGFADADDFRRYLQNFAKSLQQPFIITINN